MNANSLGRMDFHGEIGFLEKFSLLPMPRTCICPLGRCNYKHTQSTEIFCQQKKSCRANVPNDNLYVVSDTALV